MNEQQVKEFMKGGGSGNSSASSRGGGASAPNMDSLPEDCLFGDDGMLQCRFPDNKKGVNKKLPSSSLIPDVIYTTRLTPKICSDIEHIYNLNHLEILMQALN